MSTKFGFDAEQLPFCCGVYEIGNITTEGISYREYVVDVDNDNVVARLRVIVGLGRPVLVNFVRPKTSREYDNPGLMEAIQGKPGVMDLGTWVNPGSGNTIHAFMIKAMEHVE